MFGKNIQNFFVCEKEDINEEGITKQARSMQNLPDDDECIVSASTYKIQLSNVHFFWLQKKGFAAGCGQEN